MPDWDWVVLLPAVLLALIAIDGVDSAGLGEPLRPVRIKVLGSSLGVKS